MPNQRNQTKVSGFVQGIIGNLKRFVKAQFNTAKTVNELGIREDKSDLIFTDNQFFIRCEGDLRICIAKECNTVMIDRNRMIGRRMIELQFPTVGTVDGFQRCEITRNGQGLFALGIDNCGSNTADGNTSKRPLNTGNNQRSIRIDGDNLCFVRIDFLGSRQCCTDDLTGNRALRFNL